MRKIILAISLLSLLIGCGRSPRRATILIPEPESVKEIDADSVKINILGLETADWSLDWMKWKMACDENTFYGIKAEQAILEFSDEALGSAACTLQAVGTIPDELKKNYVTSDGILYTATIISVKAGQQTVEATKKYGTSLDDDQLDSEDLVAATKEGKKCAEFDTETFECY